MKETENNYLFSQAQYITNESLDAYGNSIMCGFMPHIRAAPRPVEVEEFIEFYLGLQIDFQKLSFDESILGITAFSSGYMELCGEKIFVSEGTILIDESLATERGEHRRRFTFMHEASHWILHREIFSASDKPLYDKNPQDESVIKLERQADFFAAALLMPITPLRIAYGDYFRFYQDKPRKVFRKPYYPLIKNLEDAYAVQLPEYIAKVFNVSPEAALIRLEKLQAIVDEVEMCGRK